MRPFEDIEDFFEPGETLENQLDDETLMRDLEWQKDVLWSIRNQRDDRAYADAEHEARDLGLDEPTEDMIQRHVRWYEERELDAPPNTPW